MKHPVSKFMLLSAALLCCAAGSYKPPPFTDYQPILDRMPFGPLPANFGQAGAVDPVQQQTAAQLQAEQQKLAKQVNMSAVTVTPNGATAIGFTDLSVKPPLSYYTLVGETAGGWTVVAADYDEEWAQIEKEGVTITLKLGKGLIDAPPQAPAAVAAAPGAPPPSPVDAAEPAAPTRGLIRRSGKPGLLTMPGMPAAQVAEMEQRRAEISKLKESGGDIKSYMERLRERKAQENAEKGVAEKAAREKLQELAKKITRDELSKREREINLDLIAQGAKPVTDIELTPAEEQSLVEKGVLAP